MHYHDTPHERTGPVEDDRLRLLFICCHPALAPEARIALTLRLLGGLTVPEIAHAFLVPESTMAQRITRAKKKIASAKVPYRVPEAADLPQRLSGVLAVLFLVFNEGYLATGDGDPVRAAPPAARASWPEQVRGLCLGALADHRLTSKIGNEERRAVLFKAVCWILRQVLACFMRP